MTCKMHKRGVPVFLEVAFSQIDLQIMKNNRYNLLDLHQQYQVFSIAVGTLTQCLLYSWNCCSAWSGLYNTDLAKWQLRRASFRRYSPSLGTCNKSRVPPYQYW